MRFWRWRSASARACGRRGLIRLLTLTARCSVRRLTSLAAWASGTTTTPPQTCPALALPAARPSKKVGKRHFLTAEQRHHHASASVCQQERGECGPKPASEALYSQAKALG